MRAGSTTVMSLLRLQAHEPGFDERQRKEAVSLGSKKRTPSTLLSRSSSTRRSSLAPSHTLATLSPGALRLVTTWTMDAAAVLAARMVVERLMLCAERMEKGNIVRITIALYPRVGWKCTCDCSFNDCSVR